MSIYNLKKISEFECFLNSLTPTIGRWGGRYYVPQGSTNTQLSLNNIVRQFQRIVRNPTAASDSQNVQLVIKKIRELDQSAQTQLKESKLVTEILTFIRQFFGNFFFDKQKALNEIQFPKQKLATSVGNYRLTSLEGEMGSISCRIRGISGHSLPKTSEKGVVEFFLRSIPRLRNLVAVRGTEVGSRMLGPCDYFGNLERPYQHSYTIKIDNGIPVFIQHKRIEENAQVLSAKAPVTTLQATWITGSHDPTSKINENILGESLFKRKGILNIAGGMHFQLERFDATTVDLSPFKARLVKNDTPFYISYNIISPVDDYRVVTYMYEPKYAEKQVKDGGGLFLETHSFPQTITPIDKNSMGFVTLAKWTDENTKNELEVIGVEIPFGYTLVVEEYCIHGDTNLDGMFMMCMTSSHASMKTADTVFLKNSENRQNISLSIKGDNRDLATPRAYTVLEPIVTMKNNSN